MRERTDALIENSQLPIQRYRWASDHLPDSGLIADVGCGLGYGRKLLVTPERKIVGLDISSEAILYAQNKYPGPYLIANAEVNDFFGFDAVVCLETLSHMIDPYRWLKGLKCRELVISAPLTPSTAFYPWRKHDIPESDLMQMFEPQFEIQDTLDQVASETEKYRVIHALRRS